MGRLQLVNQWRERPEDIEFTWVSVIYRARLAGFKCNSMHILSMGTVVEWLASVLQGLPGGVFRTR
jgi:hypothetical protein